MDTAAFLRDRLRDAHLFLAVVMHDVTPEQAHWIPPGVANPIGAIYAHVLLTEDRMMNEDVRRTPPLLASAFADKLGVSEPPPPVGVSWDGWSRRVRIDLPTLANYGQAVYAVSDEYLATLSAADMERTLDLPRAAGQTFGWIIVNIFISHVTSHAGEISCLKGLQGARGIPF
jgi:hypothetical protein